ncbi:hypothetical protein LKD81_17305, partial [Lachnospiraceae bacterium CLA-AA-H215]
LIFNLYKIFNVLQFSLDFLFAGYNESMMQESYNHSEPLPDSHDPKWLRMLPQSYIEKNHLSRTVLPLSF